MNGQPEVCAIRETADPSTLKNWLANKHRHLGLGCLLPAADGSTTPEDQWHADKEWWETATMLLPSDHSFMPAEWVEMIRGMELPLSPSKIALLQQGAALAYPWKPNRPSPAVRSSSPEAQRRELFDIIAKIAQLDTEVAQAKMSRNNGTHLSDDTLAPAIDHESLS